MTDDAKVEVVNRAEAASEARKTSNEPETEEKGAEKNFVPMGVTSFAQLEQIDEAMELRDKVMNDAWAFSQIVNNIFEDPGISDKTGAINTAIGEFQTRLERPVEDKSINLTAEEARVMGSLFTRQAVGDKAPEAVAEGDDTILFKASDGYHYLYGRPTNIFRDRDAPSNPANGGEIFASYAHKEYVNFLDENPEEAPSLVVWHEDLSAFKNKAQWWDYANGFLHLLWKLTDEEAQSVKRFCKEFTPGMSHRCIVLKYDEAEGVIEQYRMDESSILPVEDAANVLADFAMLEKSAGFSPRKRAVFVTMFGEEKARLIEEETKEMQQQYAREYEHKDALSGIVNEQSGIVPQQGAAQPVGQQVRMAPTSDVVDPGFDDDSPPQQAAPVTPVAQAQQSPQAQPVAQAPTPEASSEGVTTEGIDESIPFSDGEGNTEAILVETLQLMQEQMATIGEQVAELSKSKDTIAQLQEEIKGLKQETEEQTEAEQGKNLASFLATLKKRSVVGDETNVVPSGTALYRQMPKETPVPEPKSNHMLGNLVPQ